MKANTNDKVLKLPINSSKKNMQNKYLNYQILAVMTLYSNRQTQNDINDSGSEDVYRYLYRNKIKKNIEEIKLLTNLSEQSIFKNIKKLIKQSDLVSQEVSQKGDVIYKIDYEGEDHGEYVVIEEDILRCLIQTDSNTIKTYILLKYMCRNTSRTIHRAFIADNIGLSSKSIKLITKITNRLEELRLIKKENEYECIAKENGLQYSQVNKYVIILYEQYNQTKKEMIKLRSI